MGNGLSAMNPLDALGMGDYDEELPRRVQPSSGPMGKRQIVGPSNFPITAQQGKTIADWLSEILQELKKQNVARIPLMRAGAVTGSTPVTLDWSQIGLMDRFLFRNKGPDSVWIAFDMNGSAVNSFTSDLSFEVMPLESINIPLCQFYKIGCKCLSGQSATVHSVAFQAVAGNLGWSIA